VGLIEQTEHNETLLFGVLESSSKVIWASLSYGRDLLSSKPVKAMDLLTQWMAPARCYFCLFKKWKK